MKRICLVCKHSGLDKGRALDGRRAYICPYMTTCLTSGMQGRNKKYSPQRQGYQFYNRWK